MEQPDPVSAFDTEGFLVTAQLLDAAECRAVADAVEQFVQPGAGMRNLLEFDWCGRLADKLRYHPVVAALLPAGAITVQCTYFEKSQEKNWLVPLHQDLSIPVQERLAAPELVGWSEKNGTVFVQPPDEVLQQLVALRLHIDACALGDGPLKMVPGSHRFGRLGNETALALRDRHGERVAEVARGAALLMRPLILHASSKSTGASRRRVLHFVFGPPALPYGLRWRHAR